MIGYDGSEGARDAVRRAAETVSQRAALVVYVYPHAEEMAAGLVAEGLAVEAKGSVADVLLGLARERSASAIVVGSRGLGGVTSALLGSVSSKLIHDADRPIVVVPHSRPT